MTDREGWYERVFQHSLDGVLITRPDGAILRANPAACRIVGKSEEEILRGGRQALIADEAHVKAALEKRAATGTVTGEVPVARPDGSTVLIEYCSGQLPSAPGEGELGYAIFRDVTERRHAEEKERRTARALRLRTECSAAIVRCTSEAALFAEVCRTMVDVGGYRMAWVGLADTDARKTLRPVAHAGHEDGYLAHADIVWADEPNGRGPSGTAVRTGTPVVNRDFATDETLAPWRAAARQRGYRASTALPLQHLGERIGVLSVYSARLEAFDDEERIILAQLADDVAHGVHALRERNARMAADTALRTNEARLKEAQGNAHIGSWLYLPGQPLVWSDETYELYQLPRDVLPTIEAVRAVVHPEDRDGKEAGAFARALASDATDFRGEFRVIRPNGQVRWLQAIGKINRAPDGSVVDAAGTVQDVTELKQAALDAHRAATRLAVLADASRAFAEAAHDYRAVLDDVARRVCGPLADTCQVRLVSDDGKWLELVALHSHDQWVTEALREAEARTPKPLADGPFATVIESGKAAFIPARALGELRASLPPERWALLARVNPHSALVVPLRVRERSIGGIAFTRYRPDQPAFTEDDLSLAQDLADRAALAINNARLNEQTQRELSERKRAEAESGRLAAVIEQAAEIVMVTDPDGAIQYVNAAFEAVTGYTKAEALGKNPRLLKSGQNAPELYQALWATLAAGTTWHGRLTNRKKDGSLYVEDATISPVRNADGITTGDVALKRDISRDLSLEAQLFQAQKMESIGRLAGGVAHDFNNLLSVILTCARFALETLRTGDPLKEDLVEIEQAGERAAALTRQLLAFSRKQALKAEPLDLNRVIGEMQKMLERLLGEDITLVQVQAPDLGIVKADAGQVEQVVMNLAVNARDAMPGGGKLIISTANVELDADYAAAHPGVAPGAYVRIAVADSGVGMDAATQARIFEPFFTTKGPGKGTGLGLSTAYGIVAQSGGNIHVYSEPGHGTTFSVYLPRVGPQEVAAKPAPVAARAHGHETVLVVEDDQAVRSVVRRIIERAGYRVLTASNGAEGLTICQQFTGELDLVLSDVVMPVMSGPAFVELASKFRPHMKVLFMSGYTDDAIVRHGVLDEGVDFVNKPVSQTELLHRLREVLDREPHQEAH